MSKNLDTKNQEQIYGLLFTIGMWWRIIYGFLRLILGLSLIPFIGKSYSGLLSSILHHELVEDPGDFFANGFGRFITHSTLTITYFVAVYLIFWGVLDIFLPINILRKKMWAFTASLYVIGLFVIYEIYRLYSNHSIILAFVIGIDIFILLLIRYEQRRLMGKRV